MVTDDYMIYEPEISTKKFTITFMSVLNNRIVRIVQPTPDVSWIRKHQKPPTGTEAEELINLHNFTPDKMLSGTDEIVINTNKMQIIYKYGSDTITIANSHEKVEIPIDEWNTSEPEELEDFLMF